LKAHGGRDLLLDLGKGPAQQPNDFCSALRRSWTLRRGCPCHHRLRKRGQRSQQEIAQASDQTAHARSIGARSAQGASARAHLVATTRCSRPPRLRPAGSRLFLQLLAAKKG
jgi:hypothetical protein